MESVGSFVVWSAAMLLLVGCFDSRGRDAESSSTSSSPSASAAPGGSTRIADERSAPGWLVYAMRERDRVTVFRRPLGSGDPEPLFEYDEPAWDQPPQVAVSGDGRHVAYIVGAGELWVRDLESGSDELVVSGEDRPIPPNADAYPPLWSVEGMNYVSAEGQVECPECGILSIWDPQFSPSGGWVAFLQGYYEGGNWGFVELTTGRYETSGDAAGSLSWIDDHAIVTVGTFYGDPGEVRRAVLDELPSSSVIDTGGGERRDHADGVLSHDGRLLAVVFNEPPDPPSPRAARVGVVFTSGGALTATDTEGMKLAAGFAEDNTLVWIERSDRASEFAREGMEPAPLPEDLASFSKITPAGPGRVGVVGERPTSCNPPSCEGRPPPFQRRYLIIDVDDGTVIWESPGFGEATGFAGIVL